MIGGEGLKLFQRNSKPAVCKNFIAFTEITHEIAS
jgi:hypothetical protein